MTSTVGYRLRTYKQSSNILYDYNWQRFRFMFLSNIYCSNYFSICTDIAIIDSPKCESFLAIY